MIEEALIIQNGCEDIHGFDEINENVVVTLHGKIMGILLRDFTSIEKANEYKNHLWSLYEHGGTFTRDNISPNSKMKIFGN
jgi:AICAR transformylase/IMP cyclohydrolase PurH